VKRRGHSGGKDDPHQLNIQWGTRSRSSVPIPPIKPPLSHAPADQPTLIQHLPWDFLTTFPDPLEDSLEAGRFTNEEARPAIIQSFHAELGLQLARILTEQDEIADGRRLSEEIQTEVQKYAEDFGEHAAEQLLAYCRREAGVDSRNACER
jgi:hypothetical protein